MLNINDVLTSKYLFNSYLPKRLLIFVVPVGLALFAFARENALALFLFFSLMAAGSEISKYMKCRKKHELLFQKYGREYLVRLEAEIEEVGVNSLVDRYWTGLEP